MYVLVDTYEVSILILLRQFANSQRRGGGDEVVNIMGTSGIVCELAGIFYRPRIGVLGDNEEDQK